MNRFLAVFIMGLQVFLAITTGYGQKAFITVTDAKSKIPVAFCHVCFEGLKTGKSSYALTSIDGLVPNDIDERSKVAISYMGYATYYDTIDPGKSYNFLLHPSVLNMDELVVTAQYTPEKADKSIYRIEVISARQIEQKAASNMADLLKDQPNMRVGQDAIFGTTLKMQGLSGENIKFLMDGVPMIGRMNGNFDLNQINLYNVDHIEVIEGPMSVIYGSNALAGVINIITRENKSSLINASANTYVESAGVINLDGAVSANYKKHGFSIDGGRNFFDGYSNYDTSRSQTFKPRRQYFFNGYYSYTHSRFKLKLAGDYFNELLKDKGSLLPPYYETAFDNDFNTTRYSLRLDGSAKAGRSQFVNLLVARSVWNRMRQTFYKDLTTLVNTPVEQTWAQDTNTISSFTMRATIAKNNSSHVLNYQAGFDGNHETGMGEKIEGNRQEIGDYALFASLKIDPFSNKETGTPFLSIQPGIRFIYNTRYNAPIVYALSVRWSPLSTVAVRGSWSKGFRAPSIKELYLSFIDFNHDVQGNPDLLAESSNNFNLNINFAKERKKTGLTADLTFFYNLIDNVILLAQTEPNTAKYTYKNVSKYKSTGFQLGGTLSLYPAFRLQAGVSLTGITGTQYDSLPFEPLRWSPEVTFSPSYRFTRQDVTIAVYYKYSGKAPQLGFSGDAIGWMTTAAYNTMDITATKGLWNSRIKLSGGIKNVFNTTTIATTGSATGAGHGGGDSGSSNIAWGRTLFLRLAFQFNKYR